MNQEHVKQIIKVLQEYYEMEIDPAAIDIKEIEPGDTRYRVYIDKMYHGTWDGVRATFVD